MQIGKAFSFAFEDKSWLTKLLLGSVVSIVPILNFAWTGYIVQIVKNVIDGRPEPLPEWGDDFGKRFVDGLILTVAQFIYSLPLVLVICVTSGFMFIPAIISGGGQVSDDTINTLLAGSSLLWFCLICLLSIYALVLAVLLPGILANFAQKRTFASCFELGQVYRTVSVHGSSYFMVVLMLIVIALAAGLVIGGVGGVLGLIPCVGWIISLVITMVGFAYFGAVSGHLVGQYGVEAYNPPGDVLAESDTTMIR